MFGLEPQRSVVLFEALIELALVPMNDCKVPASVEFVVGMVGDLGIEGEFEGLRSKVLGPLEAPSLLILTHIAVCELGVCTRKILV